MYCKGGNLDCCETLTIDKILFNAATIKIPKSMEECITKTQDFISSPEFVQYRTDIQNKERNIVKQLKEILLDMDKAEVIYQNVNRIQLNSTRIWTKNIESL